MASALLGSVPVAFIYSFFVKYYVSGLTASAVKGELRHVDDNSQRCKWYFDAPRKHPTLLKWESV